MGFSDFEPELAGCVSNLQVSSQTIIVNHTADDSQMGHNEMASMVGIVHDIGENKQ